MKLIYSILGLVFFCLISNQKVEAHTFNYHNSVNADSIKEKVEKKTLGEYLVVVATFRNEMSALLHFNKLCNQDIPAHFFYDKPTGNYYIHIGRYYFEEDAKMSLKLKSYPQLKKTIKKVKSYPQE